MNQEQPNFNEKWKCHTCSPDELLCPCHLPSQNLTVDKKEVNSSELSKCCEKCLGDYSYINGGICINTSCPCHLSPHQEPVDQSIIDYENDKRIGVVMRNEEPQEPMEWVSELKKEPWYDGDERVEKFISLQIKQAEERGKQYIRDTFTNKWIEKAVKEERERIVKEIEKMKIEELNSHWLYLVKPEQSFTKALDDIINLITNQ